MNCGLESRDRSSIPEIHVQRFRILSGTQTLACAFARERVAKFIEAFEEAHKKIDYNGNETEELEEDKAES